MSDRLAQKRTVSYIRMEEGTAEDYALVAELAKPFIAGTADRVLAYFPQLHHSYEGDKVDRYEHSLQTATRAFRGGADEETVTAGLLHDIGDMLAPENHSDFAAALLQPYVSRTTHWIVKHHGIFQGYYFWHHIGLDRNARDAHRDSPFFDHTAEFCATYDQVAFDADYVSAPLEYCAPLVRRFFAPRGGRDQMRT